MACEWRSPARRGWRARAGGVIGEKERSISLGVQDSISPKRECVLEMICVCVHVRARASVIKVCRAVGGCAWFCTRRADRPCGCRPWSVTSASTVPRRPRPLPLHRLSLPRGWVGEHRRQDRFGPQACPRCNVVIVVVRRVYVKGMREKLW